MAANLKTVLVIFQIFAMSLPAISQQVTAPVGVEQGKPPVPDMAQPLPASTYLLGTGDAVVVRALHAEELSDKPFPVDADGNLTVPLIGKVKASGLTLGELEAAIAKAVSVYIQHPEVVVTLVQYRSEPVFLVGAFRAPGVYQLQGRRTLTELLSSIGGLLPNASRRIKLTRRIDRGEIPLSNAVSDAEAKTSSVEISFLSGVKPLRPEEDVVLQPFDVITAALSEFVFVNGEVGKTGAFELNDRDSLSVTQILSLAGGLTPNANAQKAHVLRTVLDSAKRAEIPIDIKSIMAGHANDFPLLPNDVLVLPRGAAKRSAIGKVMLYVAVPLLTTLIITLVRN